LAFLLPPAAVAGLLGHYFFVTLPHREPLRRSPDEIAASILEQTPPGSTRAEVQAVIARQGWWQSRGRGLDEGEIEVHLGTYKTILDTDVFVVWQFDDTGRLQTVHVQKLWIP
jgi:hypothetical protein